MLLVVLDGMSGAVAVDLAGEVLRSGLVEWVPSATKRRLAAAAALPTMTGISRTTLFCGEVRSGTSAHEKTGLATAFPGSLLFHKGELRAPGGAQLGHVRRGQGQRAYATGFEASRQNGVAEQRCLVASSEEGFVARRAEQDVFPAPRSEEVCNVRGVSPAEEARCGCGARRTWAW